MAPFAGGVVAVHGLAWQVAAVSVAGVRPRFATGVPAAHEEGALMV